MVGLVIRLDSSSAVLSPTPNLRQINWKIEFLLLDMWSKRRNLRTPTMTQLRTWA